MRALEIQYSPVSFAIILAKIELPLYYPLAAVDHARITHLYTIKRRIWDAKLTFFLSSVYVRSSIHFRRSFSFSDIPLDNLTPTTHLADFHAYFVELLVLRVPR